MRERSGQNKNYFSCLRYKMKGAKNSNTWKKERHRERQKRYKTESGIPYPFHLLRVTIGGLSYNRKFSSSQNIPSFSPLPISPSEINCRHDLLIIETVNKCSYTPVYMQQQQSGFSCYLIFYSPAKGKYKIDWENSFMR